MEVDDSVILTGEQLKPLFKLIGRLLCQVEDKFHLQQAVGTTKVGYNFYYHFKLASFHGLANYSGTWANKEFWIHDQADTEKEILKLKAHEKQLSWYPRVRVSLVAH